MREILTAEFEFVIGVLVNAFRVFWHLPPAIAAQGDAAIRQYFEIKHNAVPGTYRFLERCRELNVHPELRVVEGIDRASDQTKSHFQQMPRRNSNRDLHDISRTQDIDSRTAESYWGSKPWKEDGV